MNRKLVWIVPVALLFLLPSESVPAGDWELGVRVVGVAPNDDSGMISFTGTGITVDSDIVPEADLTYRFSDNWGVELALMTTQHGLGLSGGLLEGATAGSVKTRLPTLTLQYYSNPKSTLSFVGFDLTRFYAGLGVNVTDFYSYDLSSDLELLGISEVEIEDSWGFAGQVGLDVDINDRWVWNIDVKYIESSTEADLRLVTGESFDVVDVNIDPWVVGAGVAYRF